MKKICIINGEKDAEIAGRLYKDLKHEGIIPWLNQKDMLPGRHKVRESRDKIKKSDHVICILSKSALSERNFFLKLLKFAFEELETRPKNSSYLIPVRADGCMLEEDDRFEYIHYADCSISYKEGLNKILKVLPVGSKVRIGKESKEEKVFFEELFELFNLYRKRAIILLAQEDREHIRVQDHLINHAQNYFGASNIYHIFPSSISDIDPSDFFSRLGKIGALCQRKAPVVNEFVLMNVFEEILKNKKRLLLMISHFDQGNEVCIKKLAEVLKDLNDTFHNFNVLICGGKKLAKMFYSISPLSIIKDSVVKNWPELTVEDICLLFPEMELDANTAINLLKISGGHPRIIENILNNFYHPKTGIDEVSLQGDAVYKLSFISNTFISFSSNEKLRMKMCDLLHNEKLGPNQPYIFDPMIRRLYWKNLLTKDELSQKLIWRCDLIRQIGLQALGCDK